LHAILTNLPADRDVYLALDSRLPLPKEKLKIAHMRQVTTSIFERLKAEKWLADSVESGDLVLCFGNLPPLFKLRGHVMVFVQNRYLVDSVKLKGFSLKTKIRLWVERLWLSSKIVNVDEFIVQTPSMKKLLDQRIKNKKQINLLPFADIMESYDRSSSLFDQSKEKEFDFIYVASGESHKNHRALIEAWCALANEGLFPSLKLTLDQSVFAELIAWINEKTRAFNLKVENVGILPLNKVGQIYNKAGALIYPSNFESFGLPLIEARQAGLPVLAPELDYVRDVIDPEQTFDSNSPISIARAVKRFLKIEEQALPLQDAKGFLKHLLENTK